MPNITLRIINGNTGKPVEYAIITLGGVNANTNVQGIANITIGSTGQMKLSVRHSNYFPVNTNIQIPPYEHSIPMMPARF